MSEERVIVLIDGDNLLISGQRNGINWNIQYLRRVIKQRLRVKGTLEVYVWLSSRNLDKGSHGSALRKQLTKAGITVFGYEIKSDKGYPDSSINRFANKNIDKFDTLVLVSSDHGFIPFKHAMQAMGKRVVSIVQRSQGAKKTEWGTTEVYFLEDLAEWNPKLIKSPFKVIRVGRDAQGGLLFARVSVHEGTAFPADLASVCHQCQWPQPAYAVSHDGDDFTVICTLTTPDGVLTGQGMAPTRRGAKWAAAKAVHRKLTKRTVR